MHTAFSVVLGESCRLLVLSALFSFPSTMEEAMRRDMARLERQREKERLLAIQKDVSNRFAGNLVTVSTSVTQPIVSSVTPTSTAIQRWAVR